MDRYMDNRYNSSQNKNTTISKRHLAAMSSNNLENSNKLIKSNARKVAIVNQNLNEDKRIQYSFGNLSKSSTAIFPTKEYDTNGLNNHEDFNKLKNNGIITASSWRVGELLVQKQLKENLTNNASSQINNTKNRSLINDNKQKSKRTECHLIDTIPVKLEKKTIIKEKQTKQLNSKPYDLDGLHKYMIDKKTKRLYETKTEKEKQKKEDEERKRKLQELYKKQRIQNNLTNTNKRERPNNENDSKFLYEQDMSKILQDKITHLLNDNDKLVNRQRKQLENKQVNFIEEEEEENEDYEEEQKNEYNYESEEDEIDGERNKFIRFSNQNTMISSSTSFEYKHDRLKKICSMALDLQTKLQQTKLKLFGIDNEEDSFLHNNKINNKYRIETIYNEDYFNQGPITNLINDKKRINNLKNNHEFIEDQNEYDQELPGILNLKKFKTNYDEELTSNLAAKKIQGAFRNYLNKKDPKNNINNKLNELKLKSKSKYKKLKENELLLKPAADDYNFINVFKKKNSSIQTKTTDNANDKKKISLKKEKLKNQELNVTASSSSPSSTSTSLSKYMIETEKILTYKKSSNSNTSVSSISLKDKTPNQIIENEEMEYDDNIENEKSSVSESTSRSSSNSTITNGSLNVTNKLKKKVEVELLEESLSNSKRIQANKPTDETVSPKRLIQSQKSTDTKEMRYSPSSLECLLKAGLNYLDTLNTSAIHLEELDKVRCIGLAQQDTVTLAHLIRDQQQQQKIQNNQKIVIPKEINESESTTASSSSSSVISYDSGEFESNKTSTITKKSEKNTKKESIATSISLSSSSDETEKEDKKQDITKKKKKEDSVIDTILDVNDKETSSINSVTTGDEEDEEGTELEKSFKQLLPSKSHMKKSKNADQSLNDQSHISFISQSENLTSGIFYYLINF